MPEVLLSVHGVNYSYDSSLALDGLSFDVQQGEMVAIVGPNGCGKSTLLKCMSKVLRPQAGAVFLDKQDIRTLIAKDVAKMLAVVPQETMLEFDFSVAEVVLMGRQPYLGLLKREGKKDLSMVRQALELTSTLHLADRNVHSLSGGERQRVVIARALAQEPQIILLDEPTSHLDINFQSEILSVLDELNKKHKITIIAVMHDLNMAAQYFSRMMLLSGGKIMMVGTPEMVLTAPNIKEAYGCDVLVERRHACSHLFISPLLSPHKNVRGESGVKVHLVCGGGTGSSLLCAMYAYGWSVTAGVLSQGDSDWEQAHLQGIEVVDVPPFALPGDDEFERNLNLMRNADLVVLSAVPFGRGNLQNLYAVKEAQAENVPVFVVDSVPVDKRDYTGGEASCLYRGILQDGACVLKDEKELFEAFNGREGR